MVTFPTSRSEAMQVDFSKVKERYLFAPKEWPEHRKAMDRIREKFQRELEIFFDPTDVAYIVFDDTFRAYLLSQSEELREGEYPPITVFKLKDFPNWLVKRGLMSLAAYVVQGTTKNVIHEDLHYFNNLFRPVMDEWLRTVIQRHQFKVIVPRQYLIPIPVKKREEDSEEIPPYLEYAVFSERVEFLDHQEAVAEIQKMPVYWQVNFIDYLCSFIYHTGLVDAHFNNICFSKTEETTYFRERFQKIVIIDTEPLQLMLDQSHPGKKCSLAAAARAGLERFQKELEDKKKLSQQFDPRVKYKVDQWVRKIQKEAPIEGPKVIVKQRSLLKKLFSKRSQKSGKSQKSELKTEN